jgi:hypothetical protein
MYCPKCGQTQAAEDTRYCSRCGFLLTEIARIVENNGFPQHTPVRTKSGWRGNKGFKRGLLIFLLTFIIVPVTSLLSIALHIKPFLPMLAIILFGLGGLLRMAWGLLFESEKETHEDPLQVGFAENRRRGVLPDMRSTPARDYVSPAGAWLDTNDLEPRGSVTDPTTKFLSNRIDDQ